MIERVWWSDRERERGRERERERGEVDSYIMGRGRVIWYSEKDWYLDKESEWGRLRYIVWQRKRERGRERKGERLR